jgi:two-component system, response regulator PdtaR
MLLKVGAAPPRGPASALPSSRPGVVFAHEERSGAPARRAAAERILLIEDDFLVAAQIEAALIEVGFEIAGIGASADEAIELASSQRPVLCVMDIRLAGARDGIEAAIEIFKALGVRCIFATAHFDQDARTRAEKAAPLGWLQKPFSMASLVAAVRGAVREAQGRNRPS